VYASAMPRPIPCAAPVMIATRSFNLMIVFLRVARLPSLAHGGGAGGRGYF
jgi:hypothetical protein